MSSLEAVESNIKDVEKDMARVEQSIIGLGKDTVTNSLQINSLNTDSVYIKKSIDELKVLAKVEAEARKKDYELLIKNIDDKFSNMGKVFVTKTEIRMYQVILGIIGTTILVILVTRFAENAFK